MAVKVASNKVKEVKVSKKDKKVVVAPVESSSSDSSSSSEEEVVVAPVVVAKVSKKSKAAVVVAPVESSSSSSSSESEAEEVAKKVVAAAVESSSSSDSSDSDSESVAPVAAKADSGSDSSSSSDSESEAPAKRAATEETEAPAKKQRVEEEGEGIKSLFIGNLGWGVTIDDLFAVFGEYGTVLDARIANDPQTGRSRGFGYIDYDSAESAQKGLAASGMDLQGRNMNVDLAQSRQKTGGAEGRQEGAKTAPADCLFVGNLSFNSSEDSLAEIFGEYGTVTEVRLPTDRETGRKKGFGYIQFGSIEEATAALEALNGQDIDGRSLRCDYSGPRPAPSGDRPERGGRGGGFSRGGRGGDRGGRGGRGGFSDRGGGRGGRGGFSDRGASRGGSRGGAAFSGKRTTFE